MAGSVTTLSATTFDEVIGSSSEPVLVDFYKVDTDNNKQYAAQFGVRGIPTLIVFKDGKPMGQLIGMQSKSKIESLLKQATG